MISRHSFVLFQWFWFVDLFNIFYLALKIPFQIRTHPVFGAALKCSFSDVTKDTLISLDLDTKMVKEKIRVPFVLTRFHLLM